MKTVKVLTLFCLLSLGFLCKSAKAQIVFEHTFTIEGSSSSQTREFNTDNETMYYNFDNTTNIISIFKADFSLYKTITIIPPSGYHPTAPTLFSSKLFNDDNLLEFIEIFYNPSDNNDRKMILYNENLNVIMDFGNRSYGYAYTTMDHQTKFNVYKSTGTPNPNPTSFVCINDIYKLPGKIPNPNPSDINIITVEQQSILPFPNPASSFVNLPYSLKQNESSMMRIFNSAGQVIETFQINGTSNRLNVSIEKYVAGVYIYEYNGITNTFIVK